MLLTGCANQTRESLFIQHASWLEKCPEEKIRVVSISPDRKIVEAEVCGKAHRYQDIATYTEFDNLPRWFEINPPPKN